MKDYEYIMSTLELPYDAKHLRVQMKIYIDENWDTVEKLGKVFLRNQGISLTAYVDSFMYGKAPVDEFFLVLISRHFKVHVGALLWFESFWCSTPWIQPNGCKLIFVCAQSNSQIESYDFIGTVRKDSVKRIAQASEIQTRDKSTTKVVAKQEQLHIDSALWSKSKLSVRGKHKVQDIQQTCKVECKVKRLRKYQVNNSRRDISVQSLESSCMKNGSKPIHAIHENLDLLLNTLKTVVDKEHKFDQEVVYNEIKLISSACSKIQQYCTNLENMISTQTSQSSSLSSHSKKSVCIDDHYPVTKDNVYCH